MRTVALIFGGLLAAPAAAQPGGGGLLGGPGMGFGGGGFGGGPGYGVTWYPHRPVGDAGADLGIVRQDLSGGYPVYRDGPDTLLLTAAVRNTLLLTDARFPTSGRPVPDALWNVTAGTVYIHKWEGGRTGTLFLSGGSASDQPFSRGDVLTLTGGGLVRTPVGERDAWTAGLFYTPTGEVRFPIPILGYFWNPSDRLQVNIGAPFAVTWRPTEDVTVRLTYLPVRTVRSRVSWRQPTDPALSVYAGFEWTNEAFFPADRDRRDDRLFLFEKRLVAGVQYQITDRLFADLGGGYAFDRLLFVGRQYRNRNDDRLDVSPGAFLGAQLRVRF